MGQRCFPVDVALGLIELRLPGGDGGLQGGLGVVELADLAHGLGEVSLGPVECQALVGGIELHQWLALADEMGLLSSGSP